jgi:hypothetical protein
MFTVVNYYEVNTTHFSDLCRNNALYNVFIIPQLSQLMLDQPHTSQQAPSTTDYNKKTIQWFQIF